MHFPAINCFTQAPSHHNSEFEIYRIRPVTTVSPVSTNHFHTFATSVYVANLTPKFSNLKIFNPSSKKYQSFKH